MRMLENEVMPKVLVLFDSADERAAQLAEFAAEGARSLRFTEVDLRVADDHESPGMSHKRLSVDAVDQYDGILVATSHRDIPPSIERVLARIQASSHGLFVDCVLAAVGDSTPITQRLTELGGIVVGARPGVRDAEESARKTGERVARVVEWVRHSLSHEHGHGDTHHAHSHQHPH